MCEREWWSVYTLLEGQQEHEHYVDDNKQHHNEEHNNLLSLWGKVATQHGVEESHPLPTPPSWATSTSHQSPGLLLFPPLHLSLSSVAFLLVLSLHTTPPRPVWQSIPVAEHQCCSCALFDPGRCFLYFSSHSADSQCCPRLHVEARCSFFISVSQSSFPFLRLKNGHHPFPFFLFFSNSVFCIVPVLLGGVKISKCKLDSRNLHRSSSFSCFLFFAYLLFWSGRPLVFWLVFSQCRLHMFSHFHTNYPFVLPITYLLLLVSLSLCPLF